MIVFSVYVTIPSGIEQNFRPDLSKPPAVFRRDSMVTLGIMILGFLAGRIFPARHKGKNEKVQLFFTLLLIFTMGVSLGQREGFFSELLGLGLQSFVFFLIPTLLSVAVVFPPDPAFYEGIRRTDRTGHDGRRPGSSVERRPHGVSGSGIPDPGNPLRIPAGPGKDPLPSDPSLRLAAVSFDVFRGHQRRAAPGAAVPAPEKSV